MSVVQMCFFQCFDLFHFILSYFLGIFTKEFKQLPQFFALLLDDVRPGRSGHRAMESGHVDFFSKCEGDCG